MAEWEVKRFWTAVSVAGEERGWTVRLDDRPLSGPVSRAPLILPSLPLAEAVAEEWRRQEDVVRPQTMFMTRMANTAQDRVAVEFDAIAGIVAAYAETDLLCYRADAPAELVARQAEAWDPLLDWADTRFGARLRPTEGVVPRAQARDALDRLAEEVRQSTAWRLTGLHELVALSGSLVIGLAVDHGVRTPEDGWELSRIDEEWQAAQWGRDDEAEAAANRRREEFLDAARFLRLVGGTG